ncbi:hypothetical protein KP003_16785 [Geomonas nitrogeniifigens]|nr:hypothetical protein [Geomonas nitrogeniifigens]QXE85998.1 hypothetical protein KP003_16785 [Geomonas nitrogeniifigens]
MGKMKENPRCHVFSIRLNDKESAAVDKLSLDEVRELFVAAAEGKVSHG